MKNINFIKTTSSQKKKKIFAQAITAILVITILFIISYAQIKQWNQLSEVKNINEVQAKQLALLDQELTEKDKLQQKHRQLVKKQRTLERTQGKPYQFLLFSLINKALIDKGQLESLSVKKKNLDLCIICPDIKRATDVMNTINEFPIVTVLNLESITPAEKGLKFHLLGVLNPDHPLHESCQIHNQ